MWSGVKPLCEENTTNGQLIPSSSSYMQIKKREQNKSGSIFHSALGLQSGSVAHRVSKETQTHQQRESQGKPRDRD